MTFFNLPLLIIVIEATVSKTPFRYIDNDNFIKYDASVLTCNGAGVSSQLPLAGGRGDPFKYFILSISFVFEVIVIVLSK